MGGITSPCLLLILLLCAEYYERRIPSATGVQQSAKRKVFSQSSASHKTYKLPIKQATSWNSSGSTTGKCYLVENKVMFPAKSTLSSATATSPFLATIAGADCLPPQGSRRLYKAACAGAASTGLASRSASPNVPSFTKIFRLRQL